MAKFIIQGIIGNEFKVAEGINRITVMCDITDIPTGLPLDCNPRSQNLNSVACKNMRAALEQRDTDFAIMNGGIEIIAKSIHSIADKKLEVNIDDTSNQGIIDGGHSYRTVTEFYANNPEYKRGVSIFVDIIYGKHAVEESVKIAAARNTQTQVGLVSIMNAEGKFDEIKESIKNQPWADMIRYEENGKQPIKVEFLIAIMRLFDIESYGAPSLAVAPKYHPCDSYNSWTNCLKRFNTLYNKAGGVEGTVFGKLIPMLPELIKYYQYVLSNLGRFYNAGGGNFGGIYIEKKTISNISKKNPTIDIFSGDKIKYYTPQAWVFPILTTARCILKDVNGRFTFEDNVYHFFEVTAAASSFRFINNFIGKAGKDATSYLKSPVAWGGAYDEARISWMSELINNK